MAFAQREQGETRQQILQLLLRASAMTATELSEVLGIGAVGVRQHLALLERDGLVAVAGVRRSVGRPSHLYTLTTSAHALFPRDYGQLALDALGFVAQTGGTPAVDAMFEARRARLMQEFRVRLAGLAPAERLAALATLLSEQGYMSELRQEADGSYTLTQHNCPIDCIAREYPQACAQELLLYEDLLDAPITRAETIAEGGICCRYRIRLG